MVDQLAGEYAAAKKPVVFLEHNIDDLHGARYNRWWAAYGGSGTAYLPFVMVDSGQWFSNNYLYAAAHDTYAAMVDAALARPPRAEITAQHQRVGNRVHFTVRLTNRSDAVLSFSANAATVHAVVYEENRGDDHLTGRVVRAAVSLALTAPLASGAGTTIAIDTPDIATVVDWGKVKAVVFADYRPLGATGAYDMLQAVRSTTRRSQTFVSRGSLDGWVLEATETSQSGRAVDGAAAVLRVGDDGLDRQYRGILSFDTGGLPDAAVVTGAVLKLRLAGQVGDNPLRTHAPLLADVKTGTFGASRLLQPGDFQAPASQLSAATFRSTPVAGWYTAVLPGAAQRFVNRVGTTQFRVRFARDDNDDRGADFVTFHSGEAAAADRPRLVVTYTAP